MEGLPVIVTGSAHHVRRRPPIVVLQCPWQCGATARCCHMGTLLAPQPDPGGRALTPARSPRESDRQPPWDGRAIAALRSAGPGRCARQEASDGPVGTKPAPATGAVCSARPRRHGRSPFSRAVFGPGVRAAADHGSTCRWQGSWCRSSCWDGIAPGDPISPRIPAETTVGAAASRAWPE
jgi:hypothetical protein